MIMMMIEMLIMVKYFAVPLILVNSCIVLISHVRLHCNADSRIYFTIFLRLLVERQVLLLRHQRYSQSTSEEHWVGGDAGTGRQCERHCSPLCKVLCCIYCKIITYARKQHWRNSQWNYRTCQKTILSRNQYASPPRQCHTGRPLERFRRNLLSLMDSY